MRASIAIQIEPNCQDDYEAVRIVDEVIDYIRSTGLHYYVGPSETSIEGDDLAPAHRHPGKLHAGGRQGGSAKVSAYCKLVYKPHGAVLTIDEKVTKHHQ